MAVHRTPPKCHLCGEEYKGIYKDQSDVPTGHIFVGDTFIRWDIEGHNCRYKKENRPAIEKQASQAAEESDKFKAMFVDWKLALRLKAIGFTEPCFAYYWTMKDTFHYTVRYENHNRIGLKVSAPLWQQVIDWLDSKKLFIDIDHEFGEDWAFTIDNGGNGHSGDEIAYMDRTQATKFAIDSAISIIETIGIKTTNYKDEPNIDGVSD